MITITKLEAAQRQLDAAITLLFSNGDSVAVHSLAAAASNVFADLAEHKNGGLSWRARMRDDSGLSMSELKTILHKAWNFFKHADRDPNSTLSFNDSESDDVMFMAVADCGDLQPTSCVMQAFQIWYIAAHPGRFPATESVFADAQNALPGLSKLERPQQLHKGREFLLKHCGG